MPMPTPPRRLRSNTRRITNEDVFTRERATRIFGRALSELYQNIDILDRHIGCLAFDASTASFNETEETWTITFQNANRVLRSLVEDSRYCVDNLIGCEAVSVINGEDARLRFAKYLASLIYTLPIISLDTRSRGAYLISAHDQLVDWYNLLLAPRDATDPETESRPISRVEALQALEGVLTERGVSATDQQNLIITCIRMLLENDPPTTNNDDPMIPYVYEVLSELSGINSNDRESERPTTPIDVSPILITPDTLLGTIATTAETGTETLSIPDNDEEIIRIVEREVETDASR